MRCLTSPANHVTRDAGAGPTISSPYPRRLEHLTIYRYIYKASKQILLSPPQSPDILLSPYPRRLERLTICRYNYKASKQILLSPPQSPGTLLPGLSLKIFLPCQIFSSPYLYNIKTSKNWVNEGTKKSRSIIEFLNNTCTLLVMHPHNHRRKTGDEMFEFSGV